MVILNLPDEPNTPAGKAIKVAMAPSTEQLATELIPNKFKLIFNSNPNLGDCVFELFLDLGKMELVFTTTENGNFDWIDWILDVPKNEVVTLFFLDNENKHRCILEMRGVYVFDHVCFVNNAHDSYISSSEHLEHKITMQFDKIGRIYPEGQEIKKQPKTLNRKI